MDAYCTLLYTPDYAAGAIVLGNQLRMLDPGRSRTIILTKNIPFHTRQALADVWQELVDVETVIAQASETKLAQLGRPGLGEACSKINVWGLVKYKTIVFLDADVLPIQSLGELFSVLRPGMLIAAAPDIGWPDIFNSGVFVCHPSVSVYEDLRQEAVLGKTFDGSDQGLLNQYFAATWQRLPFLYNVTSSASYQYGLAFDHFRPNIRAYHFIGPNKPWDQTARNPQDLSHPNSGPDSHKVSETAGDSMLAMWQQAAENANVAALLAIPYLQEQLPASKLENVIAPRPDRWDPTTFPPPRRSEGEAANFDEHEKETSPQPFVFPRYGTPLVKFPWETNDSGTRPTIERVFRKAL